MMRFIAVTIIVCLASPARADDEPPSAVELQRRSKPMMFTGLGLLGGGLVLGTLSGLTYLLQLNEQQRCAAAGSRCLNRSEIELSMTIKTGAIVVSGVMAVVGAVLLICGARKVPAPAGVSIQVGGPGSVLGVTHF